MNARTPRRGSALAGVALALLLTAALAGTPAYAARELTCKEIPQLLSQYLQKHVLFHYLNDELRTRALDSYIKRLDPTKTFYLESEAVALSTSLRSVFHECVAGGEVHPGRRHSGHGGKGAFHLRNARRAVHAAEKQR